MHDKRQLMRKKIEESLSGLPIMQYAWLGTDELPFSERVREICREECPRYGSCWSCPPGVGTVEECREKCLEYREAFVFTTAAEVQDIADLQETLSTRQGHEEVMEQLREIFRSCGLETAALSGDSCARCPECTYPDAPCRFPDKMLPCIEGYGIVVPLLAERAGIVFDNGGNIVTWFGILLWK